MNILKGILPIALSLVMVVAFWIYLDDALLYKEDAGVIPALWIAGFVVHGGFLGILYYHLKGWGVIDINWLKNWRIRRKK